MFSVDALFLISCAQIYCVGNEGYLEYWNVGHCQGIGSVQIPSHYWLGDGMEMICDGVDCPYAKVRSYSLNGTDTDTLIMEPDFEDGSGDEIEYGTTDEPWATTDFMYSSTVETDSSSGEDWDWADYIDCDANEFDNWEEIAVAINDCVVYNNTGILYVCQDGEFTMEYHDTADCSGSALHSEPHFAHEGICPLGMFPLIVYTFCRHLSVSGPILFFVPSIQSSARL